MPHAPLEYNILNQQNVLSILCVPIQSGSRILGYLGFDSLISARFFSEAEIDNLQVIVNLLGEVLQKHDIETAMDHQAKLQQIISRMAMKYINLPSKELDESITESLSELATFSRADRAYIFEYDWTNGVSINSNEWIANEFDSEIKLRKLVPNELMEPWTERHKRGEIVVMEDISTEPIPDKLREILLAQEVKSMISLPLMQGAKCTGYVGFDYIHSRKAIGENDVTLLSLYAQLLVNVRNRRSLENKLILERDRAESANRAKSEFLANMSHEIRTPLNGVIGFAELLFNSGLDDAQHMYARNIVNSSYNLLGIISDILDFSKIEAGKLELSPIKTDLIELVEHATDIIKVSTSQKNLELLLDIAPQLPRYAVLDPLRVNQILINLLSNAEKFTDQGEVELKVQHKMTDADHGDICFSVRDTGIGIEPGMRKRLFRAFSQLDSSTTRKYGGTGLGLVISNHLASLMKSKIELNSEIGKGSVFSFCINCRVEGEWHCAKKLQLITRVMIVDDNQECLRILKTCLALWNIEVVAFSSPRVAIEYAAGDIGFDAILVDYGMPELNGLETISQLRLLLQAKAAHSRFILMHNSTDDSVLQEECIALELRYRLIKPIKANQLHELLLAIESKDERSKPDKKETTVKQHLPKYEFEQAPRILIAEDNFLNMALLKEMIHQLMPQTELLQASDGLEAIAVVRQKHPDLVLMDVQMPNLDGVSASHEIRKFSTIPIVAITAGALQEEQDRCLAAGMNAFLTKPVLANELVDTLLPFLPPTVSSGKPEPINEAADMNLHFNQETLLKNISRDMETLSNLLDLVKKNFPWKIADLQKALEMEDMKEAKSILHSLKGSAQNMHFVLLGKLVAEMEKDLVQLSKDDSKLRFEQIFNEWQVVLRLIS
jgi:signal transduction histidine kinase/DNA-binding response OmpR family regulator